MQQEPEQNVPDRKLTEQEKFEEVKAKGNDFVQKVCQSIVHRLVVCYEQETLSLSAVTMVVDLQSLIALYETKDV